MYSPMDPMGKKINILQLVIPALVRSEQDDGTSNISPRSTSSRRVFG